MQEMNELPSIKSKLPNTKTSIFAIMSDLAARHNALNLSQGFPDFPISSRLVDLTNQYMRSGMNQYAPYFGILPLREQLAEKMEKLYDLKIDPGKEINITTGATEAIYATITATVNDGDEVLIFEPYYDCYVPAVKLNHGVPIFIPLEGPDFRINWEAVKNRINARTRLIILNTPHNPSGTALYPEDLKQLEKLVEKTDMLVLSDEVYQHIIFDGMAHESVLKYPRLRQHCFAIFSFGKTYHNTGWKMGYCIAPEHLMKEFRKVHQFIVFSTFTPAQYALTEFLKDESQYLELNDFYQKKRDYFLKLMGDTRFKLNPAKGTYFQLANYSDISDEPDVDFAIRLTRDYGVAGIPISVFYNQKQDDHYIRFCFAKSEETMEKAVEKLRKL